MDDRDSIAAARIADLKREIEIAGIFIVGLKDRGHPTEIEENRLADLMTAVHKLEQEHPDLGGD